MDYNIGIGNAGEFFVAGELERRGLTAALTLSNTKDFDILAINRKSNHKYAIQVKTTTKNKWLLNEKNEEINDKDTFYVFVKLNKLDLPEYHIVPSKIVSERLKNSHQEWLMKKGKKGQKHEDNSMREFRDNNNEYLGIWEYFK